MKGNHKPFLDHPSNSFYLRQERIDLGSLFAQDLTPILS
jgi:hypothetical protein